MLSRTRGLYISKWHLIFLILSPLIFLPYVFADQQTGLDLAATKPGDSPSRNQAGANKNHKNDDCSIEADQSHGPYSKATEKVDLADGLPVRSCLVKSQSLIANLNSRHVTFVDVRKLAAYEKYRIPGSLYIPPVNLKTKNYLKEQDVMLVSQAPDIDGTYQLCEHLNAAGFKKVGVISGGIDAWFFAGGKLVGNTYLAGQPKYIEPVDIYGKSLSGWIIVDVTANPVSKKPRFPEATIQRLSKNSGKQTQQLNSLKKKIEEFNTKNILVIDDTGSPRAVNLVTQLAVIKKVPVYILKNGVNGYGKFITTQENMWSYIANKPKYVSPCVKL